MALDADIIMQVLTTDYGFKSVLQKNGTEFDKVYKLHHNELDHLLIINKKLKNKFKLAIPLKYHTCEPEFIGIEGVDKGKITHHQGYKDYWDHVGTNPYNKLKQDEPPAQHYGFDNKTSLRNFIEVLLTAQSKILNSDECIDLDDFSITLSQTEKDALIKARIGQGAFRKALLDYWKGCAVTGSETEALLVSSHIKPWRETDSKTRLDPFNGLLLTPNLDVAFDKGYISFDNHGHIIISPMLSTNEREALHLNDSLKLRLVDPKHVPFLEWHRNNLFKA